MCVIVHIYIYVYMGVCMYLCLYTFIYASAYIYISLMILHVINTLNIYLNSLGFDFPAGDKSECEEECIFFLLTYLIDFKVII